MIPPDYKQRLMRGESLGEVLAGRTEDDRELVLDAIQVWLEHISSADPRVRESVVYQRLELELPEYADDQRVITAVDGERRRRLADGGVGALFGPLLPDEHGRYRLLEELGRGGQGVVYRAVDRMFSASTRATVAIKIIEGARIEEGVRARSVEHPGVVRVHDQGTDPHSNREYIVYEYLDGPRLDQWANGRHLSGGEIARIMIQLCSGIEAIHAASIVHRDIKPGNIIMMGDRAVVVDFGVAVAGLTDREPAGTPATMAPEQIEGGEGSTRVDVYGLGVVLYFLLTGSLPEHACGSGPADAGSDARLMAIAHKCLQHHAADRYPSVGCVAAELRAYLEHRPLSVYEGSTLDRTILAIRRRPVVSVAMTLVVVALTVAIIGQQRVISEGRTDRQQIMDRLSESMERTNKLTDANAYSQKIIHSTILDMRLRQTKIDPAMFWAISDLGDKAGWEEWTYASLVSAEGTEMLRAEVEHRSRDARESRLSVAYWWWLLARTEFKTEGTLPEQVLETYTQARTAMADALGPYDPIVGMINSERQNIVSLVTASVPTDP